MSIQNYICEAERHFNISDPQLDLLVKKFGKCPIFEWDYRPFETLVRSIISQQLSAKASDTIEYRIMALVKSMTPAKLLETSKDDLRGAGLSSAKIRYIRELSNQVISGHLNFDNLVNKSDENVINILTEIPGIGRWTAEMFLIFGLKRPDVLALGDAGLQRAVRLLYGETAELRSVGENWRPYRSIASWYLWKYLDS